MLEQDRRRPSPTYATPLSMLERMRDQDQEAWTRLVFIFTPLVQHVCKKWHVTGADAEDVAQEVFQAVAGSISQYHAQRDGARTPFRSWLGGIIQHKLADWLRRRERQVQGEGGSNAYARLQELTDSNPAEIGSLTTEDLSVTNGVCQRALQMLRDEFEPQTWQAFWRTAVDGQSATAVADELGMKPAAVRKAKSRVLHRLKVEIGDLVA